MFGIVFLNHPDPRHLLLPHDWTIFPLRKDFKMNRGET
jgi:NADH-quinone oxidoreductase subunit C